MLTQGEKLAASLKILKHHNKWRRANSEPNREDGEPNKYRPITPTILGFAIDTVVEHLEQEAKK